MQLNPDVWQEIVSYLWYPDDLPTLRSLALTSKIPSKLALDAIWRDGENFSKIVSVINSFATSPSNPFLECQTDMVTGANAWVLHRPFPHAACQRAVGYLARIRKIKMILSWPTRKGDLLISHLPAWLEHPGPLFPYLQRLEIGYVAQDVRVVHIGHIIPIISPTLQLLGISAGHFLEHEFPVLPILELARARGCDLKSFSYLGSPAQHAPEVLVSFEALRDVHLRQYSPQPSSITATEFLASLPSLRSLSCGSNMFMRCTAKEKFCHTSLLRLHITSWFRPLPWESFRQCVFPSVTLVEIEAVGSPGFENLDPDCPIFDGLGPSCPTIQAVKLTIGPDPHSGQDPVFDLRQLTPLLSSSTVEDFELLVPYLAFTPPDFRVISESWPNLEYFEIYSMNGLELEFTALPSLVAFSNHPKLRALNLNIEPRYLLNNITEVPDLIAAYTPIQNARSRSCTVYFAAQNGTQQIPVASRTEKRLLVACLLLMFPGLILELGEESERDNPDGKMLAEFEEILLEMRRKRDGFV